MRERLKNITPWQVTVVLIGLMFLIPFATTVYWFIFGMPDTDTGYLSWDTEVSIEEPWINEAFEIEITHVQIGSIDENGMRPCEIIMKVVNHDVVTHRSSRELMTFVQYESDSVDAYRGKHGSRDADEIGEKPEKTVKNVMEIWTSPYEQEQHETIIEHGLSSFFVEKGKTAFFVYQASIPESFENLILALRVSVNKEHTEQYRRDYVVHIDDYLNDVKAGMEKQSDN